MMKNYLENRKGQGVISSTLLLAIIGCCGCGGGETRRDRPLSPEVGKLGIVLTTDTTNDPFVRPVMETLSRHFVDAGYLIVHQEAGRAQVVGSVSVTSRQEESILQISLNGQQSVSYDVTVQLTIFGRNREIVDQLQESFSAKYGRADEGAARRIVSQVRTGRRLDVYAKKVASADAERIRRDALDRERRQQREAKAREEEEHRQAEAREAERLRQEAILVAEGKADDSDWNASSADGCRGAVVTTSCDGVVAYVKKRPEGKHVTEAREAFKEGAPRIARLTDDKDWKEASVERCQHPSTRGDCDGVRGYVEKHPEGAHVTKARSTLLSSSATIESLQRKAILRAEASQTIEQLCQSLDQLENVEQAEKRQHRVDVESGTVNLYERRNVTAARVYLQDRTKQLSDKVARAGVQFNRKRDCTADE